MDGGQWGDAMRAIDRVRERLEARLGEIEQAAEKRLGKVERDTPTLRDRFAMAALAGAMPAFFEDGSSWEDFDDMAGTCYQVADAMLRAREVKVKLALAEARDEGHEAGRREALYLARLIVHGLAAPGGGTFPPGSVELHDHVLWFLRSCGLGSAIDGNRIGEAEAHRALAGKP